MGYHVGPSPSELLLVWQRHWPPGASLPGRYDASSLTSEAFWRPMLVVVLPDRMDVPVVPGRGILAKVILNNDSCFEA